MRDAEYIVVLAICVLAVLCLIAMGWVYANPEVIYRITGL